MGKLLGSFSEDERAERPDLNQCPDCECFFDGDNCPICNKECPQNMRAGNRPVVKQKKRRKNSGNGRVTFISWYHTWVFIIFMMIFSPIISAFLIITSPHEKWKKIVAFSLAAILMVISTFGIGSFISTISDTFEQPVNNKITRSEYVAMCENITAEQFYRSADGYDGDYVKVRIKIVKSVTYMDSYYNDKDYVCYLCEAPDGSDYEFVVRDCLLENQQRFIPGDVITVYGEGAGECEVYYGEYELVAAMCLNMAYVDIE